LNLDYLIIISAYDYANDQITVWSSSTNYCE